MKFDYCCIRCKRFIKPEGKSDEATCGNEKCNLNQEWARCRKEWYAKVYMVDGDEGVDLVFHHEQIMNVLQKFYPDIKETQDLEIGAVHKCLRSLPKCKITYVTKGLVVTDVPQCEC